MKDIELLPCPFCGAACHFEKDEDAWEWVECESCGMQGNRSASLMDDCKPILAEAWNRRTAIEADRAQRVPDWDAFEKAVQEYIEYYEMLGETEDGRDACYTPNENDKALLLDAFMGFDFSPWLTPSSTMKLADEFELRRLLAEERETNRQLIRALRDATEGPTFMGEPVLAAQHQEQPQQVRKPTLPPGHCASDWGGRPTGPCLYTDDEVMEILAAHGIKE